MQRKKQASRAPARKPSPAALAAWHDLYDGGFANDDPGIRRDDSEAASYIDRHFAPLLAAADRLAEQARHLRQDVEEYGLRDHAGEWISDPGEDARPLLRESEAAYRKLRGQGR